MFGRQMQLAKRDLHRLGTDMRVWAGICAVGIILGLAGPFDTGDVMRTLPRMIYWTGICALTYFTGAVLVGRLMSMFSAHGMPSGGAALAAGVILGPVIMAEVAIINWAVFGASPFDLPYMAELGRDVILVAIVVTVAGWFVDRSSGSQPRKDDNTDGQIRLLDRLPLDKRGALLALSVSDHYTEIRTDKGTELVLMRLSDAIAETAPLPGLQTHRSHWVSLAAVTSAQREAGRAVLTLTDGHQIPVSRSNLAAAKEAGLLPG